MSIYDCVPSPQLKLGPIKRQLVPVLKEIRAKVVQMPREVDEWIVLTMGMNWAHYRFRLRLVSKAELYPWYQVIL